VACILIQATEWPILLSEKSGSPTLLPRKR
jgi:hypothetical protein